MAIKNGEGSCLLRCDSWTGDVRTTGRLVLVALAPHVHIQIIVVLIAEGIALGCTLAMSFLVVYSWVACC